MKFVGKLSCALVLALLVQGVFADHPHFGQTPMEAAENDARISRILNNYLEDGFTVTESFENEIRYKIAPTGNYDWGNVIIRLRSNGISQSDTFVTITAYIGYMENADSYRVTRYDVHEVSMY